MTRHLTVSQLTLVIGIALAVGAVLILTVYMFHKLLRRQLRGEKWKPRTPRAEDTQSFTLAALQGVIASLREEQKKTQELLRASELRAEESVRRAEVIAREIEEGLMVFDREGFISLANTAARTLLAIDVWSRRRYQEVLGPDSELARRVESCLGNATLTRREAVEYRTPRGEDLRLIVTVVPLLGRSGEISGAVCLVKRQ